MQRDGICAEQVDWVVKAHFKPHLTLLCAGITTYSPLRTWNVGPGSRVAVVGIGGLGHLAVRLAAGLGATVTVIARSEAKSAEAARRRQGRALWLEGFDGRCLHAM
jgi:D-arabinose 1-dehydrogenase-like Zn-dependent alcohol dehydrogenase